MAYEAIEYKAIEYGDCWPNPNPTVTFPYYPSGVTVPSTCRVCPRCNNWYQGEHSCGPPADPAQALVDCAVELLRARGYTVTPPTP